MLGLIETCKIWDVFNKDGNIPAPNGDVIHNVSDVWGNGGSCYGTCEIGPCKTKVACNYEASNSPNPKIQFHKLHGRVSQSFQCLSKKTKNGIDGS